MADNSDKDSMSKRPQFGTRHLKESDDVFSENAWDNVEWDEQMETEAKEKVAGNSGIKLSESERSDYEQKAAEFWDKFYGIHSDKFFQDRNWLFTEFPELENASRILEIGCGVGNTVAPILKVNENPQLTIYASDFSSAAIKILQESKEEKDSRCIPLVLDASEPEWIVPFPPESLDLIVIIFCLSAIAPDKHLNVIRNCRKYLRTGGLVLFRDYGRYDMAQLRFKPGRCLSDNFYVRGDGTRVFYFDQSELRDVFVNEGFEEVQNIVDRRLQVNRFKMLKMYRVWIQCKYKKL